MYIEREQLTNTINELEETLKGYVLPIWDELPDIELYMDQVITLTEKYLALYQEVLGSDKIITHSMINNYVKLEIIPAPVKKKYSRIHLAYLILLCTLKQTLDISTIKKIIGANLSEEEVKKIYNSFVKNQQKAFLYVTENVRSVADPILNLEGDNQDRMNDLLLQVASSANIFKIMTKKFTDLSE